jgi:hypothetical protein
MGNPKFYFISVVVPSINGNYAKLLLIEEHEFEKLKALTALNSKEKKNPYALYIESNSNNQFFGNGGFLTKEQFSENLRELYNSIMVWNKNNKALKKA